MRRAGFVPRSASDCRSPPNVPPRSSSVALRPEEIDLIAPGGEHDAVIARARFLGDVIEYTVLLGGGTLTVRAASDYFHPEGSTVGLSFARAAPVYLRE